MIPSIRIEKLGKRYRVNHAVERSEYNTLRESLVSAVTWPLRRMRQGALPGATEDFWALRDVELEIQQGEAVGIIGRNGAGKSTLLKILSRITKPTSGRAVLNGRVGSLLEVGTGFHPELTGRENVYLNGSILGMSRQEISRNFDAIVDFSGVEKFLDTPVKRYSSGMQVRLAFAVAAYLEPEILVVDEVLAVGDAEFQRKCLGKMHDVARGGRTVLFVSHNMAAVRSLTTMSVYLKNGKLATFAPTSQVIEEYLSDSLRASEKAEMSDLSYFRRDVDAASPVRFQRIWVERDGGDREPVAVLKSGDSMRIVCEIEANEPIAGSCVSLTLSRDAGDRACTLYSPDVDRSFPLRPGMQRIEARIRNLPLSPGHYILTAGIAARPGIRAYDVIVDYPLVRVELSELDAETLHWQNRPWGSVQWKDMEWHSEG